MPNNSLFTHVHQVLFISSSRQSTDGTTSTVSLSCSRFRCGAFHVTLYAIIVVSDDDCFCIARNRKFIFI